MSTTNSIEQCWVLVGAWDGRRRCWQLRRRRPVCGHLTSVEADWAWALAREEEHGDVVGFWHTHPGGAGTSPSDRDIRTMRAWHSAFGKPLVCVITEGRRSAAHVFVDDATGAQRAQLYTGKKRGSFIVRVDALS